MLRDLIQRFELLGRQRFVIGLDLELEVVEVAEGQVHQVRLLLQIRVFDRMLAESVQLVEIDRDVVKSAIALKRFTNALDRLLALLDFVALMVSLPL